MFPGCETVGVPIADGVEGTVDAVIAVTHGSYQQVTAVSYTHLDVYKRQDCIHTSSRHRQSSGEKSVERNWF